MRIRWTDLNCCRWAAAADEEQPHRVRNHGQDTSSHASGHNRKVQRLRYAGHGRTRAHLGRDERVKAEVVKKQYMASRLAGEHLSEAGVHPDAGPFSRFSREAVGPNISLTHMGSAGGAGLVREAGSGTGRGHSWTRGGGSGTSRGSRSWRLDVFLCVRSQTQLRNVSGGSVQGPNGRRVRFK